jgi:hypothetical protein
MSGSHWGYKQYALNDLAGNIQEDIERAGKLNAYGENIRMPRY